MATYDVLSVYPEGRNCDCCRKKISKSFFITISGRTVCSINCKNNLKTSPEDSCYVCKRPVWEGNCYATRTKYICSEKCKDSYIRERNQNQNRGSKGISYKSSGNNDENLVFLKIKYGSPFSAEEAKRQYQL